jgi:hypothetical protein
MLKSNNSPLSSTAAALNESGVSLDAFRLRLNTLTSREQQHQQFMETEIRHAHERLRQKAAARLRDSVSLQNTVEIALEKRVESLFESMSKTNEEDVEKDDSSLYGTLMKRTDKALIEREATYAPIKKCVERAYELWGRVILSVLLFLISSSTRLPERQENKVEFRYAEEQTQDEMLDNYIDSEGENIQGDREE